MRQLTMKAPVPSRWKQLLAALCVLLVIFGATVEIAHSHPAGQPGHDCSLCIVAHSAARASAVAVVALVLRPIAECVDPQPLLQSRTTSFDLRIRPPPVVLASI